MERCAKEDLEWEVSRAEGIITILFPHPATFGESDVLEMDYSIKEDGTIEVERIQIVRGG